MTDRHNTLPPSKSPPVNGGRPQNSGSKQLSRRQMLGILGGLGATIGACGIGGLGGLLWLAGRDDEADATPTPRIVIVSPEADETTINAPNIIPRTAWGALPPNHDARFENGFYSAENPEGWRVYEGELHETYTTIVVHHSVIYINDDADSLLDVQRLHREDRRWADVAYHFFIGRDGNIYEGRDIHVRGTHTGGYNTGTLGICFLGNYEEIALNDLQIQAFDRLMRWLLYRLQPTHIAGHKDFNAITQCPGANIVPYLPQWATQYGLVNSIEGYRPPADATSDATATQTACACGDPRCGDVV
jgi:hypothetical protein